MNYLINYCKILIKYDTKIARFAVNHANGSVTLAAHVTRPVGCSKRTQWVHKLYEALFLISLLPCRANGAFSIWKRYLFVALSSSKFIRILRTFVAMFGMISGANYVVIFVYFLSFIDNFWRFCEFIFLFSKL